ncbi:MAG TPA: DUF3142 domain-containing protein [Thermoanaerobaculia bacterium]|jgi:hypothetical protein|nr:DUF3142 domain-containing protein [Thermoanaerobaculia bacterium]
MSRPSVRLAVFLCLLLPACRGERASGPLPQGAYVWQRSWTPAVRESVRRASGFSDLIVLAAEVDPRSQPPQVVRVPLDAEVLKGYRKPVGVAIRVHTFPGRFADDPGLVSFLQGLARGVAAEARAKGISLSEIQIDYDCPESKVGDYRVLLAALRPAVAPARLTFTALPAWLFLAHPFRGLIQEADGYVLQLHSLKPPEWIDEGDIILTDPPTARGLVKKAASFGRPFRAALPTYSYQAAFDSRGHLIGLLAEGPLLSFSPGSTVRTARSDPAAMAGLIREWTHERPKELQGILWYRLPVEGDRRNWTWPTLRAAMAGRAPRSEVRAAMRKPEPGLVQVDIANQGEAEAPWPSPIRIRWQGEAPIATDGLAVYKVVSKSPSDILLVRSGAGFLRPGARSPVAWLRFSTPTEVQVELP